MCVACCGVFAECLFFFCVQPQRWLQFIVPSLLRRQRVVHDICTLSAAGVGHAVAGRDHPAPYQLGPTLEEEPVQGAAFDLWPIQPLLPG